MKTKNNFEIKTVVSTTFGGNMKQLSYVLTFGEHVVIIDAGASVKQLAPLVKNKKVDAVFLTHCHFDHIPFVEDYQKEFGATVFAHNDAINIAKNSHLNLSDFFVDSLSLDINPELFKPLKPNGIVDLGFAKIKCIASPGHSYCGYCFLIGDCLFCGDTIFAHGIGATDFHTSSKTDLKKTLSKICKLNYKTAYPGHGKSTTKEEQIKNIAFWIDKI